MTVNWGVSDAQMGQLSVTDATCQQMVQMASAAGVASWRVHANWARCSPSPAVYNWTAVDRQISLLHSAGITPVIVLGVNAPKYLTSSAVAGNVTQATASQFAAFVTAAVQRYGLATGPYGAACSAYEVWTEPNNGRRLGGIVSATSYVAYLQAAYNAVKAVSSSATVIFGALQHVTTAENSYGGWWSLPATSFLTKAYAAGAQGYFDVLAYKAFTDVDGTVAPTGSTAAIAESDSLASLMSSHGDGSKPIWWICGYSTADYSAAQQSSGLQAMFSLAAARPQVGRIFVQQLRDSLSDPTNHDGNYGILAQNLTPKAAYTWLASLAAYSASAAAAASAVAAASGAVTLSANAVASAVASAVGFVGEFDQAIGQAIATASANGTVGIAGSASGTAQANGSAVLSLAGSAVGTATATALGTVTLSGSAAAVAWLQPGVGTTGVVGLNDQPTATATATGVAIGVVGDVYTGSANAVATATASASGALTNSATGTGTATGSAAGLVGVVGNATAVATATTTTTGTLSVSVTVTATATGSATGTVQTGFQYGLQYQLA